MTLSKKQGVIQLLINLISPIKLIEGIYILSWARLPINNFSLLVSLINKILNLYKMEVIKMYNQISSNNKKDNNIDVIKEVSNAREGIINSQLIMQEDNYYPPAIKMVLGNSLKAMNNVQRWFLRNPHALEDFNNSISFYDEDIANGNI